MAVRAGVPDVRFIKHSIVWYCFMGRCWISLYLALILKKTHLIVCNCFFLRQPVGEGPLITLICLVGCRGKDLGSNSGLTIY